MNKTVSSIATATILILALAGSASSANATKDLNVVYDKVDRVLVTVEYKAEMTFMGQSEDIEGRVLGLSVEPQGMIIFDGTSLASLGSGSPFSADVFGATRVEKPKSLKVTDYKGNTYDAEYIGVDQYSSIAFCRLPDSVKAKIPAAQFKAVDLAMGETVYALWMLPKGYQPRFQMARTNITGVLSKPEKYFLTGELTTDFLMAPVVTASGDLVGVITPVTQDAGAGPFDMGNAFGIPVGLMPVDRFTEMLAKPPAPGEFKRGWLGIAMQALDPDIAAFWGIDLPGGVIVTDIIPNSPAEKAGFKAGDFIIAVDNQPVEIKDDAGLPVFQKMISESGVNVPMAMTVIRPGETLVDTLRITAVLEEMPTAAADAPRYEDKNFDLTVRGLVFADFNVRSLKPNEVTGVVVDKIEPGGWAAVDGVMPGDIIMKINDREVTSADDAKEIFAGVEKNKDREAVLLVWRFNNTQFINVKTHWE